jgi:hypothetical protein
MCSQHKINRVNKRPLPFTLISLLNDLRGVAHYTFLDFTNDGTGEPFTVEVELDESDVIVSSGAPISIKVLRAALVDVNDNLKARRIFQHAPDPSFPFSPIPPAPASASGPAASAASAARPEFVQAMEEVFGPGGRVMAEMIDQAVGKIQYA